MHSTQKHGNRFARLSDYQTAKESLQIALVSTNRCLAEIRDRLEAGSTSAHGSKGAIRRGLTPLQIQEQEMLVVSKECFYVLAHVCQSTGKPNDAHKCLDRIERYIDEQRKRDDEMYNETVRMLSGNGRGRHASVADINAASVSFPGATSSDLALVGPKNQDKEDIRSRAQAARARGRQTEVRERSNLTFVRIMIDHHSMGPSQGSRIPDDSSSNDREAAIDRQLNILAELSAKVANGLSHEGGRNALANAKKLEMLRGAEGDGSDNDVFELVLSACRLVSVRRLKSFYLDTGSTDDIAMTRRAYDILLRCYTKNPLKGINIAIDQVNAILTTVQLVREKTESPRSIETEMMCSDGDKTCNGLGREKRLEILHNMGIDSAEALFRSFQQLSRDEKDCHRGQNPNEGSTLVPQADKLSHQQRLVLLKKAKLQFSRAVSLYRSLNENHATCAKWADLLLRLISVTRSAEQSTRSEKNGFTPPAKVLLDGDKSHAGDDGDQVANIIAVKAYSLSMSGELSLGLSCARVGWKDCLGNHGNDKEKPPNTHNLAVLFHCALLHQTKEAQLARLDKRPCFSSVDSLLLELDDAISELLRCSPKSAVNDLLGIFPTLASSCVGIQEESSNVSPVLLGLQQRWISILVVADSFTDQLLNHQPDSAVASGGSQYESTHTEFGSTLGGEATLFCLLRAYLQNYERLLLRKDGASTEPFTWLLRSGELVDRTISLVLDLLQQIRDRKAAPSGKPYLREPREGSRNKQEKGTANCHGLEHNPSEIVSDEYKLIWDNPTTQRLLGDREDCIFVAEQIWNLAVLTSQSDASKTDLRWLASQFFAKAHDFAILSEEEEGMALSRGHLECDGNENEGTCGDGTNPSACDLSSEFSAQSLLLSVANAVDAIYLHAPNQAEEQESCESTIKYDIQDNMRVSLKRLERAKAEFLINRRDDNGEQNEHLSRLIAWLSLRSMIEIGDDDLCMFALDGGGLTRKLMKKEGLHQRQDLEFSPQDSNQVLPNNSLEKGRATAGKRSLCSPEAESDSAFSDSCEDVDIVHMYLCCNRAEVHGMLGTAKLLLSVCATEMINRSFGTVKIPGGEAHSLGEIQRKIIQISFTVDEAILVFEDVAKIITESKVENDSDCNTESTGLQKSQLGKNCYSQSDVDWFTIEAYNRGVNLTFLGDILPAERLLSVSLNLLPSCGREVQCHGAEMRLAYRYILQRKDVGGASLPSGTSNIMRLFGGVVPSGSGGGGTYANGSVESVASARALFSKV